MVETMRRMWVTDFKGMGHFEAKFSVEALKGYISRQYLWTLGQGNVLLQLCRCKFSHKRNFIADFIRLKLNFIQKTKNRFLSHHLGDLGITYALHL